MNSTGQWLQGRKKKGLWKACSHEEDFFGWWNNLIYNWKSASGFLNCPVCILDTHAKSVTDAIPFKKGTLNYIWAELLSAVHVDLEICTNVTVVLVYSFLWAHPTNILRKNNTFAKQKFFTLFHKDTPS